MFFTFLIFRVWPSPPCRRRCASLPVICLIFLFWRLVEFLRFKIMLLWYVTFIFSNFNLEACLFSLMCLVCYFLKVKAQAPPATSTWNLTMKTTPKMTMMMASQICPTLISLVICVAFTFKIFVFGNYYVCIESNFFEKKFFWCEIKWNFFF